MIIKNVNLGDLFLAPMAGVTDVGFRKVCKLAGADVTCTEMVSSKALIYDNKKTKDLLITTPQETTKQVQIFGHVADEMAKVCTFKELQKFDIIDINFGCPAPKIVKNGDGSALLKNLPLMASIVSACRKATNKILSCKFRIGFNQGENIATQVATLLQDCGADFVTIHGRTTHQGYSGEIDYETIAKVKSLLKIPVVGNGNVFDEKSFAALKSTNCNAVMVARGALGDPNIFARLKGLPQKSTFALLCEHVNTLKQFYPPQMLNLYMKKHLLWYLKNVPNCQSIKKFICQSQNINDCLDQIASVLN